MKIHTKSHRERLLESAIKYLDQGKTIIPLNGKVPLIKGWADDDYSPNEEDVERWFKNFGDTLTGIGLRTGYFDDVFVLDLEVEQDLSQLDLPKVGVRSKSGGGGIHYYFSDIGEDSFDFTSLNLKKHGIEGDIKGNRQYIVAPPSLHPDTGNEYEWIEGLDTRELQTAPKWLIEIINKSQSIKEEWHGVFSGTVEEGNRHNTAVRIAGKLLSHIPENDWDEIVHASLVGWNNTLCNPPLPKSELNKIYSSLCEKQKSQRSKNESRSVSEIRKPPLSVRDVLNIPESEQPKFLVTDLIPEWGITAIAGHPGCGKSWMMMELARAVATGTNFLQSESMQTIKTNVLIVDEESGIWEMRRRMKLLQFKEDVPIHFYSLNTFKLDNEENVSYLVNFCTEHDIGLVVFDPFAAMHNGVENNAEEMQLVMGAMQKFIEAGITVVFIHHHRKGNLNSSNGLSLRGSSAILGRLDSLIVVEKIDNNSKSVITLRHAKSRRGKNARPIKVTLAQQSDDSPVTLIYEGEVSEAILKKDKAKSQIVELLKYENLFKEQIIDALIKEDDIGSRNVNQALKELEDEGKIIMTKNNRKNYYQINTDTQHVNV